MRVLVIAARDPGGSLYHLTQALRRRAMADVRLVVLDAPARACFPSDIVDIHDGGGELRELVRSADVLHFVDLVPDRLELLDTNVAMRTRSGTRVCVQLDGNLSRTDTLHVQTTARRYGWSLLATRPGLAGRFGAHFLPPFVPYWRAPWMPLTEGTRSRESLRRAAIVFVSSLVPLQQNPTLEAMVDRAEAHTSDRLRLEIMTAMAHRHVLRRRRSSHLTLTASRDGLGRNALEALAQGVRVVADLDPDLGGSYAALAGGEPPPIIASTQLEATIAGLDPRQPSDEHARRWAVRVLDPMRWFDTCTALWSADARAA